MPQRCGYNITIFHFSLNRVLFLSLDSGSHDWPNAFKIATEEITKGNMTKIETLNFTLMRVKHVMNEWIKKVEREKNTKSPKRSLSK